MTREALRREIDEAIAAGNEAEAFRLACTLWSENTDSSAASFFLSCLEKLRAKLSLAPCRIAVLRSFTVEPCIPLLRAEAAVGGIGMEVHVGDFNTYAQDILDPDSGLYRFAPDIVILAAQTRDVAPDLWYDFTSLSAQQVAGAIARVMGEYRTLVQTFRSRSHAYLVVHGLDMRDIPNHGLWDYRADVSQGEAIRSINDALRDIARQHSGVYILDYDGLVSRFGRTRWHDERKWLTMRMPVAANHLIHLAREWMRFIHPLTGKVCKALVTDLDNTLWGGIIGEDGFGSIKIGADHPGAAFQSLQRAMLDLYQRGILLAVCSKNNPADAMEVLEKHPGMVLKPRHFAAMRINWQDKAQNLAEIAAELNLGTDALAFMDDNPAECRWVRSRMPEVSVIELSGDPAGFAGTLRNAPVFERLTLSAEDRQRGRLYAEQRLRADLQHSSATLEDYYRSLRMEMEIAAVAPETHARVAQLTQKTNQFNLTTRRYSERQIEEMSRDRDLDVLVVRVLDQFGDNGIVGVAIVRHRGGYSEIDSFLLSCRVIGRTIETAMLAFIEELARGRGSVRLAGWFLPTPKNAPAGKFYPSHGFVCSRQQGDGSWWELELTSGTRIAMPPWIQLRLPRQMKGIML